MSWDHERDRHEALLGAIQEAAHTVAAAITKGLSRMADAQTAALADLTAAVTGIADSISAEITALQAAVTAAAANAANMQPDDSAAIEAQVTKLNDLNAALKASVAPVVPPVTPPSNPAT